jgi:hypothetical protein
MAVTRQQLYKHIPASMDTHAIIRNTVGGMFALRSVSYHTD